MDGQLANLITLTTHGSAYLNGVEEAAAMSLQQTNSWLAPVRAVIFSRHAGVEDQAGTQYAIDIGEWLRQLRSEGVKKLSYVPFAWERSDVPEHVAAGYLNGVPMAIQANLADGKFEIWYPQWSVDQADPQKPWTVQYRGLAAEQDSLMLLPPVGFVKNRLADAINYVRRYASSETFIQALNWLNAPEEAEGLHGDLLPASGYPLDARRVLACAATAHVFSGENNWNEIQPAAAAAKHMHDTLGAQLYAAIKLGVAYGANTQSFA